MSRKHFLTLVSIVPALIGLLAVAAPHVLLVDMKHATVNPAAIVMARTVGALLLAFAVLNFAVRRHESSPTLRAVLIANLVLQLALIPIDPWAYVEGAFNGLDSFVPNTILHVLLAGGFSYYLAADIRTGVRDGL